MYPGINLCVHLRNLLLYVWLLIYLLTDFVSSNPKGTIYGIYNDAAHDTITKTLSFPFLVAEHPLPFPHPHPRANQENKGNTTNHVIDSL